MEKENLNIEYHCACLLIKALNQKGTVNRAAKLLGVSEQKIYKMIKDNNIKVQKKDNRKIYVDTKEKIVYRDAQGKCILELPTH